jgi:hypothetical protein
MPPEPHIQVWAAVLALTHVCPQVHRDRGASRWLCRAGPISRRPVGRAVRRHPAALAAANPSNLTSPEFFYRLATTSQPRNCKNVLPWCPQVLRGEVSGLRWRGQDEKGVVGALAPASLARGNEGTVDDEQPRLSASERYLLSLLRVHSFFEPQCKGRGEFRPG